MPFPENGEVNIYELAKVSVKQTLECFAMASFCLLYTSFTPMGPCILTADSVEYPPKFPIRSLVNGEVRQESNTERMIFDIDHIVSELSMGMTLKAGTIISTGTPSGVGMGFTPPKFLKAGDVVECVIEGIGSIKNTVSE